MRNKSHYFLKTSLAVLAFAVPTGLAAQEPPPEGAPGGAVALSPEQKAAFDTWPPDRQMAYETWPSETKAYFWSLNEKRQNIFWRLTDDDKIALTAMTGPERDTAWERIEARAYPTEDAPGPSEG